MVCITIGQIITGAAMELYLMTQRKKEKKINKVIDAHSHGFTVLQLRKDKIIVMSILIIFIAEFWIIFQ